MIVLQVVLLVVVAGVFAYAKLYFTPCLWPDFTGQDLDHALKEFRSRDRRFRAVPAAV